MRDHVDRKTVWKKYLAAAAVTALVFAGAGCGSSNKSPAGQTAEDSRTESATEILTEETVGDSAVVGEGVTLPENFDNMPYVLEALMLQDYAKNRPYYTKDASEENADSFYCSMAVLASLIEQKTAFGDGVESGKYYYISEETVDKYASALYDAVGRGDMEFPELSDNNIFALYDEEIDSYAFVITDPGSMTTHITECSKVGDRYSMRASLYNGDSFLKEYQFEIVPTSFIEEQNEFAYSVADMAVAGEESGIGLSENTEEAANLEDGGETAMDYENSGEKVSIADARNAAAEYAEEPVDYERTDEIDGREYYFFKTENDKIYLVDSHDLMNVFGARENKDGSWTFDQ